MQIRMVERDITEAMLLEVIDSGKPLKAMPKFACEAEERAFWEKHGSAAYTDWTKAKRAVLPNLKSTTET